MLHRVKQMQLWEETIMKHLLMTAALVCGLPVSGIAQDVTLKMGHAASSKHIFHEGMEIFAATMLSHVCSAASITFLHREGCMLSARCKL